MQSYPNKPDIRQHLRQFYFDGQAPPTVIYTKPQGKESCDFPERVVPLGDRSSSPSGVVTGLVPRACTCRKPARSLQGRPTVGRLFEACAGRGIRWLCLPAVALFCGLCLPACHFACHAHCPSQRLPPSSLLAPVHSFSLHCALPRFIPCAPGSPLLGPAVC